MSNHSRRHQKKHSHTPLRVINLFLLVIFILLSVVSLFLMYRHHFLAFRHLNVIYGVVIILIILASLFLCIKNKARIFTTIILVLSSIFVATTLYGFKSTIDLTNNLNKTASYSEIEMSVVVPKDSKITNIEAVSKLAAPVKNDTSNITDLIEHIKSEKGISITPQKTDSYQDAYNRIKNGDSQAMVLNNAYVSLIELSTPDFKSQIKTIYTYKIKKKINRKNTNHKEGVFNIYISGIDTFGSISTVSRSDVNIIMTVNTNTHKVLLTTTPRDAYVKIPDGGGNQYDKLTHAGLYGVETSMKTLENLYDINLDYYARINFSSFFKINRPLGRSDSLYTIKLLQVNMVILDFPVGQVTLNSEQALGFVRERYSLQGGDNDRGRNQEKVIAAIINKLASSQSVTKLNSITSQLQTSVQTNMTIDNINDLINNQLSTGQRFTVESQALTGHGSTGELPSYAMPGAQLYMMSIDQSSLSNAKSKIKNTMEE
uniref:CpsA n=4 Tax=Streptococcus agalactiae TaxID=1311 RepID=Q9RPC7_STRAG|nr:CpsA [Streptococcus agalactiae COH1]